MKHNDKRGTRMEQLRYRQKEGLEKEACPLKRNAIIVTRRDTFRKTVEQRVAERRGRDEKDEKGRIGAIRQVPSKPKCSMTFAIWQQMMPRSRSKIGL